MYARTNQLNQKTIEQKITSRSFGSSYDPDAFGPAFWFTLHNASTAYPENPTRFIQDGMKQLLLNLPIIIPCVTCKEHFWTFLKAHDLEVITSSRVQLFHFLVAAHNAVNKRFGKIEMSVEEAKALYGFYKPLVGASVRITYG